MSERGEVLWEPPESVWSDTEIGRFAHRHGFDDYARLHRWSVADLEGFWRAATHATGVRWRDEPTAMLSDHTMPGWHWFPGGRLNYAEHALSAAADPGAADRVAVVGAEPDAG